MATFGDYFLDAENKTNLIINYLPQSYTDEQFQALFQTIGPTKSCKICRHKATGYSYGFGFVEYFTPEHAQLAIDTLNGHQVQNKFLKVALSRKGGDRIKGANLYIRNIPKTWSAEDLKRLFFPMPSGATEIMYVRFADDNTNKLRPPMQPTPPVQRPSFQLAPQQRPVGPMAQAMMNRRANRYNPLTSGMQIPPNPGFVNQGTDAGEGYTLFVYNIGATATEAAVYDLFSPYGEIKKIDIMWDWQKQQCKGFCFVTMTTLQQAHAAIIALNGFKYASRPLQVKLKTAKG